MNFPGIEVIAPPDAGKIIPGKQAKSFPGDVQAFTPGAEAQFPLPTCPLCADASTLEASAQIINGQHTVSFRT